MVEQQTYRIPMAPNQVYLERPRIDRLLEKAVQKPIVTVLGGAGYGKSRAVYAFVRNFSVRTSWLQFSEGDNDVERFWENFVQAVAVLNQGSAARLAEFGFPVTGRQFDRYVTVPRADIVTSEKYIFVYDDIHLIRNKTVLGFIEHSITSPFPNITSILISRNELDLDLSGIGDERQVARITEDDLRFSREETADYFRHLGLWPSPETLSAVYGDTEGWAFATNLAGLSLRKGRTGNEYVPQALRSNIFRLMENEVLSELSAGLRAFLIKLSLIEHPVLMLLREIAGENHYFLIDEMEQIGSFIQYDPYFNGYRIHNLFLDYLKSRQGELSDAEKQEVWDKAAAWCIVNNHKIDAIQYYEKNRDYHKILQTIYAFPLIIPNQTAAMLFKIMENVPPSLYDEEPSAWIVRSRLLLNLERFDQIKEEMSEVIAGFESGPARDIQFPDEASRPWSPTEGLDTVKARTLSECYESIGFAAFLGGSYTRDYSYKPYFERAHYYFDYSEYTLPPLNTVLVVPSYVCRVRDTDYGQMERYNETLSAMVFHLSAAMNGCGYGLDDASRGELAFFKADLIKAEEHFNTALIKAREKGQYEIENYALFYLLRIHTARGNSGAIHDLLRQLDSQVDQGWYTNRFVNNDIAKGWFYVRIGRGEKVASWLKSDFEESDLNSLAHGFEILVKARYHFGEKRYPSALSDLESRSSKFCAFALLLGKLETKVLEAVCRYRLDDLKGAFRDLETAWELARNNNLFMPFTELGKDMRALAGAALKEKSINIPLADLEKIRRNASLYAKNVFSLAEAFSKPAMKKEKQNKAGTALSSREMSVLTGLSQGLTREEIARVSAISVNNVKSVVRRIYNKLGAVNRADAVRIAINMGILRNYGQNGEMYAQN